MAIGITGANNGYSRPAADNRFIQTAGGTVTGNLTVTGTLSTTLLEALSANITVIDIKQYELSGFNVQGNATVQGSVSATGDLTVNQRLNFAGDASGANNLFFRRNSSNNWTWGSNGVGDILGISGNIVTIGQDTIFSRRGITIRNMGESTGATLLGEATDVLAQRRNSGNAAQESRIYSTYTDASNYERFFIKTNVGATSATQIGLSAAGTGQNRNLELVTGGSTRMTLTSAGNVGIDTSSPASKLHISGAMGSGVDGADACGIRLTNTSGGTWRITSGIGGVAHASFGIGSVGSLPYFVINGNASLGGIGNIGIGTTAPASKLSILDTTLAGSGALSGSALDISQTWNTTGAPTAIKLDVTDTTSNAASLLMDLRVGGFSRFAISKNGGLTFGSSTNPVLRASVSSDGAGKLLLNSSNISGIVVYGSTQLRGALNFFDGAFLQRDNVGENDVIAQRNGIGQPQAFRLYNTYTSSTNFERLNFRWDSNVAKIGTEKGSGGGAPRDLVLETDGTERVRVTAAGTVRIADNGSGNYFSIESARSIASLTSYNRTCGITFGVNTGYRGYFSVANNSIYGFSSSADISGGGEADTAFSRVSAGVVGVGTGTAGSTAGSMSMTNLTASGDIEATDSTKGIILKSPNGARWRITVTNGGALSSTDLTPPAP